MKKKCRKKTSIGKKQMLGIQKDEKMIKNRRNIFEEMLKFYKNLYDTKGTDDKVLCRQLKRQALTKNFQEEVIRTIKESNEYC